MGHGVRDPGPEMAARAAEIERRRVAETSVRNVRPSSERDTDQTSSERSGGALRDLIERIRRVLVR